MRKKVAKPLWIGFFVVENIELILTKKRKYNSKGEHISKIVHIIKSI